MELQKQNMTVDIAADYEPPIPEGYYDDGNDIAYTAGHKRGFVIGANWQKEQDKELIDALKQISAWPGNLPDERYTSKTGPNDAALRGSMVVAMRTIANNVINKLNL